MNSLLRCAALIVASNCQPFKRQYSTPEQIMIMRKTPKSEYFTVGPGHGVAKCTLNTSTGKVCCIGKKEKKKCTNGTTSGTINFQKHRNIDRGFAIRVCSSNKKFIQAKLFPSIAMKF